MLTRRRFLARTGLAAGGALALPAWTPPVWGSPHFTTDPFTLGVASGDPDSHGVVLWTRLAPDPLNGGGMPPEAVPVTWRVAADPQFRRVVRDGVAWAVPELAHAVHVEVDGLAPDRWYWYRFEAGNAASRVGRTRTLPAGNAPAASMRFAVASCQNWQAGLYPAWHNVASDDLDLVVFLGDYIYEGGIDGTAIRQHDSDGARTLETYRNRHALYKSDPSLQDAHAAFPWLVTWDDHEVSNNYAGPYPAGGGDPAAFLLRRAAGYQAYYEHMPLRRTSMPSGPDMALYRGLRFGRLVEFSALDTRQYRSDQPCGDQFAFSCPAASDPSQTMTGPEQERWLLDRLDRSKATWNVIAQQTMFAPFDFLAGQGTFFSMDQWDGYLAARSRLLGFIAARRPSNPIVLSGDIHSAWVHDLLADFADPASEVLATEFVTPSISSSFPTALAPFVLTAFGDNPHARFFNGTFHGYIRCTATPRDWLSEYRVVATTRLPRVRAFTLASFVVQAGRAGVEAG